MAETPGVSRMVLSDVFVLVSDEIEDDLSNNLRVSLESSPQRVGLPMKSDAHFQKVGVVVFLFVQCFSALSPCIGFHFTEEMQ